MIPLSEAELLSLEKKSPALAQYRLILKQAKTDSLRLQKTRKWTECAALSLLHQSTPENICRAWSDFTDTYLQKSWDQMQLHNYPIALFALGKLGAQELNLSSDIDLVITSNVIADEEIERAVRKWIQFISQSTADGPGYRLDFDLRPGGKFGPLVPSTSQLEDYYWSRGSSWERLALVRLRFITGSNDARLTSENIFQHFTYRKFLDFRLLQDLKSLRVQIRDNTSDTGGFSFHLKLGPGGIRDIELFTNALQVIHGGKDSDLRTRSTTTALQLIKNKKIIPEEQTEVLLKNYWYFRGLENHAQAINDQQTHSWSPILGAPEFEVTLRESRKVAEIVTSLLGDPQSAPSLPSGLNEQQNWLRSLGFSTDAFPIWEMLMKLTALSSESQSDEALRQKVLYKFILSIQNQLDPHLGISNLLEFIRSTRAKAGFFSLLIREPRLIDDLSHLFSVSPFMGQILSSRPELLDSFVFRTDNLYSDDIEKFLQEACDRKLITEIVAASEFLRSQDTTQLTQTLTERADEITSSLSSAVSKLTACNGVSIIPLGKWAAREMGFRSDLDFIFVTDNAPTEAEHKYARKYVSYLTESKKGGALYSIDLRLRPSGSAGPILISKEKLIEYFQNTAAAWERQSYLRLRNTHQIEKDVLNIIIQRGLNDLEVSELKSIRQKLHKEIPGGIDIKYCPGGMIDIEFAAQISFLKKKLLPQASSTLHFVDQLSEVDTKWRAASAELKNTYMKLRTTEQLLQLVSMRAGSEIKRDSADIRRLAKLLKLDLESLIQDLLNLCAGSFAVLKELDPIWSER